MAAYELPHPLNRTHPEETAHVSIAVDTPQPGGKADFGYAVFVGQVHIPGLQRIGKVREQSVGQDRKHQEESGSCKKFPDRKPAEEREQHSHSRIEHQDITAPKEKKMEKADDEQRRHPPVELPCPLPGIGQLDAEADAEQDREQGIEFTVDEEILKGPDHPVKGRMGRGIGESPQGKLREVGQDDAQERKSAQSVQNQVPLLLNH